MNLKKISTLFSALLLTPLTALAISVSDLHNNPERYVLVDQDSRDELYVDSYSIASLRYDPPYYAMRCKAYFVAYSFDFIMESTLTATYDYNRCLKSIVNQELRSHPGASRKYIQHLIWHDLTTDTGLTGTYGAGDIWDLNGNHLISMTSKEFNDTFIKKETNKIELNTPAYHFANYMFYKEYNEYFMPRFESKTLY